MVRLRHWTAGVVIVLSSPLALAAPAMAQFNPFHGTRNGPAIAATDFRMLDDSASKLNEDPQAHAGQSESWSNPADGASGTVTIARIFRSQGMTCHVLRYGISVRRRAGSRSYDVTWCQTPGNDWKIKN